MNFLLNGEVVSFADSGRRRRPFAHAVERQNRGGIER